MTEKTYSKENSEAYKAAKDKLEQRKREAGIKPKPVEYYAVRQTADRKFAVATISADGLVTVAKAGIATIEEAKRLCLIFIKASRVLLSVNLFTRRPLTRNQRRFTEVRQRSFLL